MKNCSRCHEQKSLSEFYKMKKAADGYRPNCKECERKSNKAWYERNRANGTLPVQEYTERRREINRRYKQSDKGKKSTLRHVRDYQARYPEKRKANHAVWIAITAGRLPAATDRECARCSNRAQQYHHYLGYAEEHQLDVLPLCVKCHNEVHRGESL